MTGAPVGGSEAPGDESYVGPRGGVTLSTRGLPAWLGPVVEAARTVRPHQLSRFLPPRTGGAASPPC